MKKDNIYIILMEIKDDIGYMRGHLDGLEKHVDTQNGRVDRLEKRFRGIDRFMARATVFIGLGSFMLIAVSNWVYDFIQNKLF